MLTPYTDEDGNAITEEEYEDWIVNHEKGEIHGYESIVEAYENMIIWE